MSKDRFNSEDRRVLISQITFPVRVLSLPIAVSSKKVVFSNMLITWVRGTIERLSATFRNPCVLRDNEE